jgi:hypothetical protein
MRKLLVMLVMVAMVAGCARVHRLLTPATPDLVAEPLPLCHLPTETVRVGQLEFRGALQLTWPGMEFGGWSDLRVEGDKVLAVGDDGHWLRVDLTWQGDRLVGAHHGRMGLIAGEDCPGKLTCDAESLTQVEDRLWVGFEHRDRIRSFPIAEPPFSQTATDVPLPPGLPLGTNEGLEVVTVVPGIGVLALEEGPEDPQPATLPAWLWDGKSWESLKFRTTPGFRPTGATALPANGPIDADLLVLERYYRGGVQQARVSAVRLPPRGGTIVPRTVALLAAPMLAVDNFEGIAAFQVGGETRVLLLSDDNQSEKQRTLLVAFALSARLGGSGCGDSR